MGTLIRETAAAAGDEIEAVFGRDDLGQLGRLGRVADVVMDFSPAGIMGNTVQSDDCCVEWS